MSTPRGTRSLLATLPDGASVMSVLVEDDPQPRHLYQVISPDGTLTSDHATLTSLAQFLSTYGGLDDVEPVEQRVSGDD